MTVLCAGAARGGALRRERRDQVVEHRLLDRRCQVQRLHPGVDHHEEGQRGDEAVSQALRLGQMSASALGQIRCLGDRLQARKQRPHPTGGCPVHRRAAAIPEAPARPAAPAPGRSDSAVRAVVGWLGPRVDDVAQRQLYQTGQDSALIPII